MLALAACGGDGGDATTSAADTTSAPATTAAPTATSAPDTTPATTDSAGSSETTGGGEAAAGISTAETDLGTILVDGNGMTLYLFTNDSPGETVCYDDCAALWPPVPGDTPVDPSLDASMFGTIERDDGGSQLTVNDQPLYLYEPDTSPGDVTGQGVGGVWFVLDANGEMVGGPDAANTGAPADDADDVLAGAYGY